jgi:hypothetical protein
MWENLGQKLCTLEVSRGSVPLRFLITLIVYQTYADGKLNSAKIISSFEYHLKQGNFDRDVWVPVIEKSVEACRKIEGLIFIFVNSPRMMKKS